MEKIINKRLIAEIEYKNLNNPSQHGFRKEHGTDTAIIYENIAAAKSRDLKTNIILRDISKAFDKVWHAGLLHKLIVNNFPPSITRILSSYLHNRSAQIRIENYTGPAFKLECGVPQGACLSPSLFGFYTHDIPKPTSFFNENIIYADDITQIVNYKSENILNKTTEKEIKNINEYEKIWKIQTNMKKFQIIPVGGKRKNKIKIDNREIDYSQEGKTLGTIINQSGFLSHAISRISIAKTTIPQTLLPYRPLPSK